LTSAGNKTIPYESLPTIKNPREEFIAAMDGNIPPIGNQAWTRYARDTASQIRRIDHLLQEKEKFSVTDCKQIQSDILSLYALDVLETALPEISSRISQDSTGGKFIHLLSGWSGEMKAGSTEAVFFEALLANMTKNFFQDELGESLYSAFSRLPSMPLLALEQVLKQEKHAWIDDITTTEHVETKQELIVKSFRQAAVFLREQLGQDETRWTWGALHTLTFNHPLGKHPLLRKQFNLGPFHVGGSSTTIRCSGYDPEYPFHVAWGASARMLIDLGNPNNSISILPTGQSGQPLDEHYRDQLPLYVGNLYHPNLTDTLKIVQSGWNCLQLIPEGSDEKNR
jgi:penicillin amidase